MWLDAWNRLRNREQRLGWWKPMQRAGARGPWNRVVRRTAFTTAGLLIAAPLVVDTWMGWTEQSRIVVESAGLLPHPVALVFGAGLQPDGKPSGVLAERVVAAVQLYKAGKVRKLLMSGDNGSSGYDEPTAMRDYAVALGVPADDVARDFAGFRSYDTCYRARDIFGLRQVVLVSQAYHLPRVLFIARALKLDAVGFAAPTRAPLRWQLSWRLREVPARSAAVLDCLVRRRPRFLGKPEPLLARSTSD